MEHELAGHHAVITGAAGGLGLATVRAFLDEGAIVTAVDVAELDVTNQFGGNEGSVTALVADVSDEESVMRAVEIAERTSEITDLVNIAGIGVTTSAPETEVEVWDRVLAVNARGTFLMSKHVLSRMLDRGTGSIVNVSSIAGLVGLRDRAAYCASKGAIISLTRAMAADHGRAGIRVNCVCPGTIATPWLERIVEEGTEWLDALVSRQLIPRLGTPEEVAQSIVYLSGDRAAFATGAILTLDGGVTAL
jgi:NAD(P)-dependent dehydrogenase (short-subunit alcohol dehydrogenase family)